MYIITARTNSDYNNVTHAAFTISEREKEAIKAAAKWLRLQDNDLIKTIRITASEVYWLAEPEDARYFPGRFDGVTTVPGNFDPTQLPRPEQGAEMASFQLQTTGMYIQAYETGCHNRYFTDWMRFESLDINP